MSLGGVLSFCIILTHALSIITIYSGGGKSTIAALLERFYDPQSGSVELDGMNIQDINVKHLRGLIGYVGQEPTLFATTIAGNIQYGNLNATQDMIEEAARKANAHDFIMSFPDGYNTQVGDKGAQLSGGTCVCHTIPPGGVRYCLVNACTYDMFFTCLVYRTKATYSHRSSVSWQSIDSIAGRGYVR
jgi:ABC-type transport system involved in Fe-S cluster assembly fused permease/ATPase subunit